MATQAQIDALMSQALTIKSGVDALAAKGGGSSSSSYSSSPAPAPTEDPFITQLKAQMTQQQGIISSAEQDVTKLIRDAQGTIKSGAEAGAAAITSAYDREKGYQAEENFRGITTAQEAQRGFATNTALLKQIQESGDKSIKDLEMRKQELIMQGNASAAGQIATLQVKEAESLVQNRQQVFQNLISMAGLGLQAGSLQLQKANMERGMYEFDQNMKTKLGETALQYGIELKQGDTIDDVINRAMPRANEIAKFQLEDMRLGNLLKRAQIARENAQTAQIGRESEDADLLAKSLQIFGVNSPFGSSIIEAAAKGGNIGNVLNKYNTLQQPRNWNDTDLRQKAIYAYSSNVSIGDYVESIRADSSIQNKQRAEDLARLYYGKPAGLPSTFELLFKTDPSNAFVKAGAGAAGFGIAGPAGQAAANWAVR